MSRADYLHNLITSIQDRHPKGKRLEEALVPLVGLFYVVNGIFHWDGIPVRDSQDSGYYKVYPKKHSTLWENTIQRNDAEMKKHDVYHFPRGRVVYDKRDGFYELVADKHILEDDKMISRIVSEMRLPEAKVRKSRDVHYECARCKAGK